MENVSVRYIVDDVQAATRFYTEHLGFEVRMQPAPGFAMLDRGGLRLLLNAPGAGGAGQADSAGRSPEPGGWNRIQIEVDDLHAKVDALKAKGLRFRTGLIEGQGGRQALLEDPAGNLIELFEAKRKTPQPVPPGHPTVTPFLLADDAAKLVRFIEQAFGGTQSFVMKSADGVLRHATVRIGDALVMVSKGTEIYGHRSSMIHLYLPAVDDVYAQALRAGAVSLREPQNEFYGDRVGAVRDEWDNQWWIATHVEDVAPDELTRREAAFRKERGL